MARNVNEMPTVGDLAEEFRRGREGRTWFHDTEPLERAWGDCAVVTLGGAQAAIVYHRAKPTPGAPAMPQKGIETMARALVTSPLKRGIASLASLVLWSSRRAPWEPMDGDSIVTDGLGNVMGHPAPVRWCYEPCRVAASGPCFNRILIDDALHAFIESGCPGVALVKVSLQAEADSQVLRLDCGDISAFVMPLRDGIEPIGRDMPVEWA